MCETISDPIPLPQIHKEHGPKIKCLQIVEGELHSFEIAGTLKWSNQKRNQTHNLKNKEK